VSPDEISIQISSLNKEDWPWTEGVAEVVESLPNKCEALSSKQSTAKKKKKKESKSWAPVAHACNPSHSGG
jgi:hypothetical protein